jgi:hypothetical protein
VRQVHDVIIERRNEERRLELAWRGAEVRLICQFVAAASGSEDLLSRAGEVTLLPDEPAPKKTARVISTGEAMGMFGGGPR